MGENTRQNYTRQNSRHKDKIHPSRQQPCWGSLFCTNLTQPTGALDTNTGRDVLELLVRMSREKKRTVVMVTHNSFFADIADKVIRVKNGAIESVTINEHPKDASEVSW